MANAIFQHLTGEESRSTSAGIRPGFSDPFVVAVMDEIGIDVSEYQPQGLDTISENTFDVIVSLSPEAHHHAIELTRVMAAEVRYWPTLDVGQLEAMGTRIEKLHQYRNLRNALFERIKREFGLEGGPTV